MWNHRRWHLWATQTHPDASAGALQMQITRVAVYSVLTSSSVQFRDQAGLDAGVKDALGLERDLLPVADTRGGISRNP